MSHQDSHGHHVRQQWEVRAADRRTRAAARRWRHDGSEPRWARSDLRARRLLAGVYAPLMILGAVAFGLLAAKGPEQDRPVNIGVAVVCAVCAVVAVVDLLVIRHRMAEQRRWGR